MVSFMMTLDNFSIEGGRRRHLALEALGEPSGLIPSERV